jgi:hypothetical protein
VRRAAAAAPASSPRSGTMKRVEFSYRFDRVIVDDAMPSSR